MSEENIMERLNDKQREAVLATEGYVRVIAGAGSGKTKLLVSRYAYLVKDYGIDSANILCVTFTNKAAGEMKRRIRALIGEEYDTSLICTYHGFCNRILRENPEKLFLNKQFQIIDGYQQKDIMAEIFQKHELKLDYASFEAILHKMGQYKADYSYVAKMCDPQPCAILDEIKDKDDEIIEEFMQRQKAIYSLDFYDLIAFATYLLVHNEDVRNKWQDRLNYIMVDEFQDSSKSEMRLIELLSQKYQNVMIVGDPDQNIYEWRGSEVKLLVDFDKDHANTTTIILNQNYRSTPQILKCANTLIEKNTLRLKKDLFTHNPDGAEVLHYHSKNDLEEMDKVIENIKRLKNDEKYKYSDFAILYRSGFLSRIAEKKLVERNIPYEIYGGVKFYQRMEILDILAYLKLIAFDDDLSFKRIINTPRRKFGRAKQGRLEQLRFEPTITGEQLYMFSGNNQPSEESGVSLLATLKRHRDDKELVSGAVNEFIDFVDNMRANLGGKRISEIVNETTALTGYESYIRSLGDEERLDNLAEFKRIANEFEREFGEDLSLAEFLQQIALQSDEVQETETDTVKLMTIHAAKGLEFPAVFILGFTEGIFPSSRTIEERKLLGLEEERRLCYVAITRAEKHLFLMDSEGTSTQGIKKLCSRFLFEIGEDSYRRIGVISDDLFKESKKYIAKLNHDIEPVEVQTMSHKIGDMVEHHIFGKGKIVDIDERRGSYSIEFPNMSMPRSISKNYFDNEAFRNRCEAYHTAAKQIVEAPAKEEVITVEPRVTEEIAPSVEKQEIVERFKPEIVAEEPVEKVEAFPMFDESDEPDYSVNEADFEDDEQYDMMEETQQIEEEYSDNTPIVDETDPEVLAAIEAAKERAENSPNLWKRDDVPHTGWRCTGVSDLGAPVGICEMCGYQIIRYAHHMIHPNYGMLECGCVCAGKMEGNIADAKRREADLKNRAARRTSFFKRKWKKSHKGNEYLKIDNFIIVLYHYGNCWKYSIDGDFNNTMYASRDDVMVAIFERLEELRAQKHLLK